MPQLLPLLIRKGEVLLQVAVHAHRGAEEETGTFGSNLLNCIQVVVSRGYSTSERSERTNEQLPESDERLEPFSRAPRFPSFPAFATLSSSSRSSRAGHTSDDSSEPADLPGSLCERSTGFFSTRADAEVD